MKLLLEESCKWYMLDQILPVFGEQPRSILLSVGIPVSSSSVVSIIAQEQWDDPTALLYAQLL